MRTEDISTISYVVKEDDKTHPVDTYDEACDLMDKLRHKHKYAHVYLICIESNQDGKFE